MADAVPSPMAKTTWNAFGRRSPAAVYLLPWLAPSAGPSDDVPILRERLKSTFGFRVTGPVSSYQDPERRRKRTSVNVEVRLLHG